MPPDAGEATGTRSARLVTEALLGAAFRAGAAYESDLDTQTPQGAAPDEEETVRQLSADVETLPPYAVVVFRGPVPDGVTSELAAALRHTGRSDVLIVDLDGAEESWFDVVDVDMMREHGWIRADQP